MTIDEMKQRKRELGYTNQMLADKSGVPLSTVQKIFSGATASPRRETLLALENLLRRREPYRLTEPFMLKKEAYHFIMHIFFFV